MPTLTATSNTSKDATLQPKRAKITLIFTCWRNQEIKAVLFWSDANHAAHAMQDSAKSSVERSAGARPRVDHAFLAGRDETVLSKDQRRQSFVGDPFARQRLNYRHFVQTRTDGRSASPVTVFGTRVCGCLMYCRFRIFVLLLGLRILARFLVEWEHPNLRVKRRTRRTGKRRRRHRLLRRAVVVKVICQNVIHRDCADATRRQRRIVCHCAGPMPYDRRS